MAISIFTGAGLGSLGPILIPMLLVGIGALVLVLLNIFRSKEPKQMLKRNKYLLSLTLIIIVLGSLPLMTVLESDRGKFARTSQNLLEQPEHLKGMEKYFDSYFPVGDVYTESEIKGESIDKNIRFRCGVDFCTPQDHWADTLEIEEKGKADVFVCCNSDTCYFGVGMDKFKVYEKCQNIS